MRLKGKRILVTGSTTGIGKAIAQRFVEEGARVLIHGLEEDLARETSAELGGAPYHVSDLSDPAVPAQLVEA
ncbi:MAG: SDR family NAD(P)-dependent oxidoreductase, partial [Roseibacillus sp.]|nr:SDR family NAD(P)-dependent oxidoreductase [Roseibacillus sp.]